MKRIYLVTGLICAGIGVYLMFQGLNLRIQGQFGPGPGFFPFWVGLILAALSLVWLGRITLGPPTTMAPDFIPPRPQVVIIGAVVVAMIAFMLLLRPIGFTLAMLVLLLFLFFVMDRQFAVAKIAIAFVGSFGVHWVFEQILRVPLPYASSPLLRQFGL